MYVRALCSDQKRKAVGTFGESYLEYAILGLEKGIDFSRSRDNLFQPKKSSKKPASLPSSFPPHGLVLNPQPQKIFVFHFLNISKSRL